MKNTIFCVLRTKIRVLGHFLFENLYYDPLFFQDLRDFVKFAKMASFRPVPVVTVNRDPQNPPVTFSKPSE